MTVKGIIFDLDGTLLYTLEDIYISLNFALKKCNLSPITINQTKNYVGDGISKLIERAIGENIEQFDDCYNFFIKHYKTNSTITTKPYPDALNCLEKLKKRGVKLAILSNKKDDVVKELSKIYFNNIFDISLGENSDFPKKPDENATLYIIQKFNLKKEDVVFIGDSEIDIQTAKNAHINSISVLWGYKDREFLIKEGAEKLADNFSKLYDFLIQ